jgi:hypothetical protein
MNLCFGGVKEKDNIKPKRVKGVLMGLVLR